MSTDSPQQRQRERFEAWFRVAYPLFGQGRDTTIKHQLWTAWQVAYAEWLRSEIAQTNAAAQASEDRKPIGRSEGDNTSNEKPVAAAPSAERTQCRLCGADTTSGNDHNCSGYEIAQTNAVDAEVTSHAGVTSGPASAAPSDDKCYRCGLPMPAELEGRLCSKSNFTLPCATNDKRETPRTDALAARDGRASVHEWHALCDDLERELREVRRVLDEAILENNTQRYRAESAERELNAARSATETIGLLRKVLAAHEQLHASGTHGLPLSLKNEIAATLAATDSGRDNGRG